MRSAWLMLLTGAVAVAGWQAAQAAADNPNVLAANAPPPEAQWVHRTLNYTYFGFTDEYSCDGLRDTVREVLLALGARKQDMKVESRGCIKLEGPEHFPGVSAQFSVLVPVAPDDNGKAGAATANATQWKTVNLVRLTQVGLDSAPCELLQQLKEKALPLFTSRNLRYSSSCFPHQITPGEITFTVDVLQPQRASHEVAATLPPAA